MYPKHVGNASTELNIKDGALQQRVWGEVQGTLGAGRGYCANLGHSEDETGLVYMRARYYEPATGRFISEDPAQDGVNWYLYADGNPVNKVDADGKEPIENFVLAIAGIMMCIIGLTILGIAYFHDYDEMQKALQHFDALRARQADPEVVWDAWIEFHRLREKYEKNMRWGSRITVGGLLVTLLGYALILHAAEIDTELAFRGSSLSVWEFVY